MRTAWTRREFAAFAGASLLARPAFAQTDALLTRAIPGSGERIPVVGLGTASVFDVVGEATRGKAKAVIQALVANGGRIIDTASTYGDAEVVVGDEMAASNLRDRIFIATKLESPDAAEPQRSLSRLKTKPAAAAQCAKIESIAGSVQSVEESGYMPIYRGDVDISSRLSSR